ncbi:hypothetical protein BH18CHL2_BH18CHL2_04650 [soil metagenome]
MTERKTMLLPRPLTGFLILALFAVAVYVFAASLPVDGRPGSEAGVSGALLLAVTASIVSTGIAVIQPNQSAVVTFLGSGRSSAGSRTRRRSPATCSDARA